jgi:acetyl esterase
LKEKKMSSVELDPGMKAFSDALNAATPPDAYSWPLERQRREWDALCQQFRAARPPNIDVTDLVANGVPCRVFKPKGDKVRAGVIYGHGGGFVLGSPETHDDMCAEMAAGSDCVVVLVDYRLAPEHPFPALLEDSIKVWRWMIGDGRAFGIDRTRIIAAGDSAGGQMSAALALTLREMGLPQVAGMVLIYPVLGANFDTPSYLRNANSPSLSRDEMIYYLRSFLGPEGGSNWRDPKALPNLALDLSGMPPAFITVAGHDPLHDDGVIFHNKLNAAGIASDLREEPALAHSYMRARHHSAVAMEGFKAIIAALKRFGR